MGLARSGAVASTGYIFQESPACAPPWDTVARQGWVILGEICLIRMDQCLIILIDLYMKKRENVYFKCANYNNRTLSLPRTDTTGTAWQSGTLQQHSYELWPEASGRRIEGLSIGWFIGDDRIGWLPQV